MPELTAGKEGGHVLSARARWAEAGLVALLALMAAWVCLTGNWGDDFWWNDAARHAMDGVFVRDFVRDLPASLRVYQYATEYYARYPCLGLVHYPPVFPVVEAAVFAVLGVSTAAARVTVALFGALGAVFGYRVARRFFGQWGAAVFVLLFVAAPEAVFWSREVMLEVPVMAMMLVASHFFLRYVEDERRGAGVAAALLLALAVLTKQTACCLGPAWVAYAVWRRGWRILWKRESLLGAGLALALLVPFGVATVLFAPLDVGQSMGNVSGSYHHSRWSWESAWFYLRCLPSQVGLATLIGIGLLGAIALGRRCLLRNAECGVRSGNPESEIRNPKSGLLRGVVFAAFWAAACYLFFTFLIANKNTRLALIWAPALALLGAAGLALLRDLGRVARVVSFVVPLILAGQVVACGLGWRHDPWAWATRSVSGTLAAARRLAACPPGTVVFYSGRHNGSFIFHMRQFDPGGRVVVLRDSKMLYSVPAMVDYGLFLHAARREEILEVLRKYGVRYLLIEDLLPRSKPVRQVMEELAALAASKGFGHLAEYPIRATHEYLACTLHLYEFLDAGPARAEVLTLDLPLSGRVIRVPLRRLGVATASGRRPPADGSEQQGTKE